MRSGQRSSTRSSPSGAPWVFTGQYVHASPFTRLLVREADVSPAQGLDLYEETVHHRRRQGPLEQARPFPNALAPRRNVLHTSNLFFLFHGTTCVLKPCLLFNARVLIGRVTYSSRPYLAARTMMFKPLHGSEAPLARRARRTGLALCAPSTRRTPGWGEVGAARTAHWWMVLQEGGAKETASRMEIATSAYEERCQLWNAVRAKLRV